MATIVSPVALGEQCCSQMSCITSEKGPKCCKLFRLKTAGEEDPSLITFQKGGKHYGKCEQALSDSTIDWLAFLLLAGI